MNEFNIWLVGTSSMAIEYAKVLHGLDKKFITIGRGESNANIFEKYTEYPVIRGGVENYLSTKPIIPEHVIVAANIDNLKDITILLIRSGTKNILIEKPGALTLDEITEVKTTAGNFKAKIYVAYNRRFFSSVIKASEIIKEDGDVTSFNFEFTEWIDQITPLPFTAQVKKHWVLGNSSHVIDLAFFLGGFPTDISSYVTGSIPWHQSSGVFAGAGKSEKGALFSYHANWLAPGRWGVEVLTCKHRLIFKPMEELQIQNINSVKIEHLQIDNTLDLQYKPGLFLQTRAFLENMTGNLKTIEDQLKSFKIYYTIAGYV